MAQGFSMLTKDSPGELRKTPGRRISLKMLCVLLMLAMGTASNALSDSSPSRPNPTQRGKRLLASRIQAASTRSPLPEEEEKFHPQGVDEGKVFFRRSGTPKRGRLAVLYSAAFALAYMMLQCSTYLREVQNTHETARRLAIARRIDCQPLPVPPQVLTRDVPPQRLTRIDVPPQVLTRDVPPQVLTRVPPQVLSRVPSRLSRVPSQRLSRVLIQAEETFKHMKQANRRSLDLQLELSEDLESLTMKLKELEKLEENVLLLDQIFDALRQEQDTRQDGMIGALLLNSERLAAETIRNIRMTRGEIVKRVAKINEEKERQKRRSLQIELLNVEQELKQEQELKELKKLKLKELKQEQKLIEQKLMQSFIQSLLAQRGSFGERE